LGIAAAVGCALAVCGAQAADRKGGRAIVFSSPSSDEVTTNLNQFSSKTDPLKELDEEIQRSFQSLSPKSSLEGVSIPPPQRPAPSLSESKRARDLLERRRNWVFMRPGDLLAEPTIEDILKVPDSRTKDRDESDLGPMGQFYNRLATKRSMPNRSGQSGGDDLFGPPRKSNATDDVAAQNDSNLPPELKESALALKNKFDLDKLDDPSARGVAHSSFSDPFGLGISTPSKEQAEQHKKFMDGYRSLVDPTWHPTAAPNPFSQPIGFADATQPAKSPASGFATAASPATHRGLDAQADILNPVLGPAGLPDLNARALGQPRSALSAPTFETPRIVAPTFAPPKRSSF
jgi:hypothetical protein